MFSGGLDSTTVLYHALSKGYEAHCLVFTYGQRHARETRTALATARRLGCSCDVLKINLPWGGSALLDRSVRVPEHGRVDPRKIPVTYVPGRNTIFLSFALSCAEAVGAGTIFIGANAVDYSGYPDCRPSYFEAFAKMAALGTKAGVEGENIRIVAPLLRKTKAGIVRLGQKLGVPFEKTWSCYKGGRRPCGKCDSCVLRAKGFAEAGVVDPAVDRGSKKK